MALRPRTSAKVSMVAMRVLLTGGAGYIGSHTAVELIERGNEVVILDNFANSSPIVLDRIAQITGVTPKLVEVDLTQLASVDQALSDVEFEAVIHFAGLKAVGESVEKPVDYYRVNLNTTLNLLDIMAKRQVHRLVFSSSATVYGMPRSDRIAEDHPVGQGITNPYGWSKFMNEQIIRDVAKARPTLQATLLRYFNPVGAHRSGLIGEAPNGVPNNLMPFISQVAVGQRAELSIFGDDYDTADGTGVRDYIHVTDLAKGHIAALESSNTGVQVFNLGTGIGTSVLEAVSVFQEVTSVPVAYEIIARRLGDVATVIADPTRARTDLNWQTELTFADACRDTWNWQSKNPKGFVA